MSDNSKYRPPKFFEWLMKKFFPDKGKYSTVGDMHEQFLFIAETEGVGRARMWYRKQTLNSILPAMSRSIFGSFGMIKNYIRVAYRNLIRQKLFSIINIIGLAFGMACCILILQYIRFELDYDTFHENADRIYRVYEEDSKEGRTKLTANTFAPVAPLLENDFPEFEKVVRIMPSSMSVAGNEEVKFQESGFMFVDSTMFDVFSFEFIVGNKRTALNDPYSLVITRDAAKKYFGNENPIGEVLVVEGEYNFTVKGVIENVPANSHMSFDFLASFESLRDIMGWVFVSWHYPPVYTYVVAPKNYNVRKFENASAGFITRHIGYPQKREIHLQPLLDIHLYSDMENELGVNNRIDYIILLGGIAVFILFIACINFMNLTTARSERRAKEVGLRKTIGAEKRSLIYQFIGEAIFYSFLSLVISILLAQMFKDQFNQLVGAKIEFNYLNDILMWGGFITLALVVGLLAGSYPAFYLARFSPTQVITSNIIAGKSGRTGLFRKALVGLQFTASLALIISTFVVSDQIDFIRNKKLGFSKDQTIIIPVRDEAIQNSIEAFKKSLLTSANITSVTAASSIPGVDRELIFPVNAEGMNPDEEVSVKTILCDYDFVKTLDMKMINGRSFSKDYQGDLTGAFILNEAAVKQFGWENPINKNLSMHAVLSGKDKKGKVIGVVKDFHWKSLQHEIDPLILQLVNTSYFYDYFAVKFQGVKVDQVLGYISSKWSEVVPNRPFEYSFLDEQFEKLFESEKRLFNLFAASAFIAIVIASLGLFGLTAYVASQRRKEIGIRKILGASSANIATRLSKEFLIPLPAATIIAVTMSYYFMSSWLESFAYRTTFSAGTVVQSILLLFGMIISTVSYQTYKAVKENPADIIRVE